MQRSVADWSRCCIPTRANPSSLFFTGFFLCRPISLQFGRSPRIRWRTRCIFRNTLSGFGWTRRFSSPQLRPSCLLSSRDFLFCGSAHCPRVRSGDRAFSAIEDATKFVAELTELFFYNNSTLKLIYREVVYIHAASTYSKSVKKASRA